MAWLNKPVETLTIIATFLVGCVWMDSRFNSIDSGLNSIQKGMAVMKTVTLMKDTESRRAAALMLLLDD